jgi:hypothetical protein
MHEHGPQLRNSNALNSNYLCKISHPSSLQVHTFLPFSYTRLDTRSPHYAAKGNTDLSHSSKLPRPASSHFLDRMTA